MQPFARYPRSRRLAGWIALASLIFGLIAPVSAVARDEKPDTAGLCDAATRQEESRSRIPSRLLYAIALTESGRWDRDEGENIAWPWTVMARGEGKFYRSRQEAIHAVRALLRDGVTNIDVGCMQINLGYHPDAFETLHEAFEPTANVAYAATFLNALRKEKRSWSRAVRFYHSSDDERQMRYGRKVYDAWQDIRKRDRVAQMDEQRKRAALRRAQRNAKAEAPPETAQDGVPPPIATAWPPRDYRAQRQAEMSARAWAMSPR